MTEFKAADIANPALYGDQDRLQRFYAWLRQEQPVAFAEPEGCRPFWVVSRHADIRELERLPDIFNAGPRMTLLPISVEQSNIALFGVESGVYPLTAMDGVHHQNMRALTQEFFLPKNIRKLEESIRDHARAFVGNMKEASGACDFATDVAFWYPLRVAMSALGIAPEDEARMLTLTHELFGAADPAVRRPGLTEAEHMVAVKRDYLAFFDGITKDRIANPRDDVATLIATGMPGGAQMSDEERIGYYVIVATAGHDTTAASIVGGMKALIDNPREMQRLRDNPDLIKTFATEAIRWTAPVKHFMRTVTQEYELHGTTFKPGDHVMLAFGAATRDPEAFDDAASFRIDRSPNNHLAFGYGPHMCLGQYLAKLEIECFFHEFFEQIGSIELAGEAVYTEGNFVSGIRSLPVRYSRSLAAATA
ncbi:cytochrome P450 [Sphingobium lactosutens]|uniref:cytochrome P450 n=1 Tax=Sphingobium lactosutens TaxID=522773 RepID=UPI0015B7E927|nr:cytochrome P450 [Sphingobium lactosutens]NWK96249.1 cytochrome P450 [Sphingobium lactosutens]